MGHDDGVEVTARPFVGRRRELSTLTRAIDDGLAGRGSVWFLRGEPGVGKTRLALEALAHAREQGAIAALTTSWDLGGAPAYWPWVELLRSVVREDPRGRLAPGLDLAGGAADRDRFAVFDDVRRHLRDVAADRPLVLVLDDLHTADLSTLLLLRFVAAGVDDTAITLIGTYRPVDVTLRDDPGDPNGTEAAAHLDAAARHGGMLDVVGLTDAEVDELVRERFHSFTPSLIDDLVARVIERSGGNPLFVHHVVALWADRLVVGDAGTDPLDELRVDVPDSIHRLFAGRLDRLGDVARQTLRVSAVVGASFDVQFVAEMLGDADIGAHLTSAQGLELVRPDDPSSSAADGGRAQWSFAHPVVREVLLDELSASERARWHGEVVATLRRRAPSSTSADRLAHHLLNAGADHVLDAAAACETAALEAIGSAAFEDAVGHYRKGLRVLDRADAGSDTVDRLRLRLSIGLGRSMWRASQRNGADDVFDRAWAIACELDDLDGMVAAALGGGLSKAFTQTYPNEAVRRCQEVLGRLPEHPTPERGLLAAKLASELIGHPDPTLARAAALESLRIARLVDDPRCTGEALAAVLVTDLGPDRLDERMSMASEMLEIAARTGDRAIAVQARFQLVGALVQLGDRARLDAVIDAQRREVDELAEPGYLRHAVWFQAMAATVDGDMVRAEQLVDEGLAAASVAADPDGAVVWGGQLGVVRWMQGRVEEFEPLYRDMAASSTEPVWSTTLAWLWARNGMGAAARGLLDRLGAEGVAGIPRDRHWLLAMSTAAEAAARTGHAEVATAVEERLRPYADHHVPIAMGISYWGSVARPLGLLAIADGRRDEGIRHLERAIELTARFGAVPWTVEAQLDLADALLDVVGDRRLWDRVRSVLDDAGATAQHLGFVEAQRRITSLRARLDAIARPVRSLPAPAVDAGRAPGTGGARPDAVQASRPVIHVLGEFLCVDVSGNRVHWNSRKARSLLKTLVAARGTRRGREALIDQLWPGEHPERVTNRLAVALATIRRSLDPDGAHGRGAFVDADRYSVWIVADAVDVDLWNFLDLADAALSSGSEDALRVAAAAYRGQAFADDPSDDAWFAAREQARGRMADVCRALATSARRSGDRRAEADALRALLDADPYDEFAHRGLVEVHRSGGSHGLAELAEARWRSLLTGT